MKNILKKILNKKSSKKVVKKTKTKPKAKKKIKSQKKIKKTTPKKIKKISKVNKSSNEKKISNKQNDNLRISKSNEVKPEIIKVKKQETEKREYKIKDIEIGAYDLNRKEYITHKFFDIWELTSFQANVMLKDGNPFVHSHINISDRECNSKGGHLFEATVAVVGEFILRKINSNQKRKLDPDIGLACMSLNN